MRITKFISGIFSKPEPEKQPEAKAEVRKEAFDLDIIQADYVKRLLCDDELDPAVVASRFYRRYPRRQWRNLWDRNPATDQDYLTDPNLFAEGCELADAAMRKLGHVTMDEDGKEYLSTDSPFFDAMQRAFMK